MLTVAVVGTPNVGKSTLFNELTGLQQRVGNVPGVTVEPIVGTVTIEKSSVSLIDLPGVYSLSAVSEDEQLTSDVLRGVHPSIPKPDAVLLVMNVSATLYTWHLYSGDVVFGHQATTSYCLGRH